MDNLKELLNRDKELSAVFWKNYHNYDIIMQDAITVIDRKDRLIGLLLQEINRNESN